MPSLWPRHSLVCQHPAAGVWTWKCGPYPDQSIPAQSNAWDVHLQIFRSCRRRLLMQRAGYQDLSGGRLARHSNVGSHVWRWEEQLRSMRSPIIHLVCPRRAPTVPDVVRHKPSCYLREAECPLDRPSLVPHDRILLECLVPQQQTPKQERGARLDQRQTAMVGAPSRTAVAEGGTRCPAHAAS